MQDDNIGAKKDAPRKYRRLIDPPIGWRYGFAIILLELADMEKDLRRMERLKSISPTLKSSVRSKLIRRRNKLDKLINHISKL